MPLDIRLNPALREQLTERLWRDDLARMPRHLYPDQTEADLFKLWRRDYVPLFAERVAVSEESLRLFAPAKAADMRPRYLAGEADDWYAVVMLRYNRRTRYRFCYVRYWWAAQPQAVQTMVQVIERAWQTIPFDWIKFRLGYNTTLTPTDFHPQAVLQTYVVAGCPARRIEDHESSRSLLAHLDIEQPTRLEERWWAPYQALLAQQERLAPGQMDDWPDIESALPELKQEMGALLQQGGGVINLWRQDQLIGHISWRPHTYREQLIRRCWHINNIIVEPAHRQQGLGQALHYLALERINLAATPIVAGLIQAGNKPSLRTAAKLGRHIVDSYVIIPKM